MYTNEIKNISQSIHKKLITIRRNIHMCPEIEFEEHNTAKIICETLERLGISFTSNIAKTGVVGVISCENPGKTVAIRADMDALPITEENNCSYKSRIPGKMHTCGHDVHVACALGAAEILNNLKHKLSGNIKLIFQPAEEGSGGALPMIKKGVLKNPDVDACIAAHVWPETPVGKIEVKHGAIMASPDQFEIIIKGKGGHGAAPHTAIDPILIACQVVNVLQTISSRKVNPLEPIVISICSFEAGTSYNVIPERAILKGTARTFDPELRKRVPGLIEEIISGTVQAMGGEYDFNFKYLYPPTINNNAMTNILSESAIKIIGNNNLICSNTPSMVGEDFAYFAEEVPSTFFRLGCGNKDKGITNPLHSNKFDVDEDCIKIGSEILSQFAVDFLSK